LELKPVSSDNTLQTTTNNEASSDIFFYEGKIVNIKQCIQQQQAMEEERQAVLDKNNELDLQLSRCLFIVFLIREEVRNVLPVLKFKKYWKCPQQYLRTFINVSANSFFTQMNIITFVLKM